MHFLKRIVSVGVAQVKRLETHAHAHGGSSRSEAAPLRSSGSKPPSSKRSWLSASAAPPTGSSAAFACTGDR